MSKIREIREAIDTKMDKWEASATAIEAQLQLSKEQAIEELEVRKKRLNETLEGFKSEIVKAKGLADEKKTEIQTRFDELQVQLALGKAEARDSFEAQKKKIQRSIATLESTIDRNWTLPAKPWMNPYERLQESSSELPLELKLRWSSWPFNLK